MGRGKTLGAGVAGLLLLAAAQPAAAATTPSAPAAVPAAATTCAPPSDSSVLEFSATDPSPAAVTAPGGSTVLSITFTTKTYFNYLDPIFSVDTRNGNDGAKPTYTPPSFEYSVNGGSWSSTATYYDSSGMYGGDVWAANLPQWTGLAEGTVLTVRMKVTFSSSMPSGSYDDWFGMEANEVCSAMNLNPRATSLSALTYSPAAAATKRPSSPSTSSAASRATNATPAQATRPATAAASGSATGSASAAASAPASGSTAPTASPSSAAGLGGVSASSGPSAAALDDAQNAADHSSSGSGALLWGLVLGVLVLAAGLGGALTLRRRRSRT